ncbi:MAG: hypothetical protein IKA31_04340, partial [Clostridia bacterium]|nr:hypothetical protein [Clostridia bacterium]
PYYRCDEHGIKNFSSDEGVYAPLSQFAAEKGISYNVDHFYSPEKQMDLLHFQRNMAEDSYRYLTFVRNNPKLNLTDDQIAIMDYAIERYHQTCEYALSKDIPLDFTEENTPNATYEHLQQHGRHADYNRSFEIFGELYCIVEDAFTCSEFYETVDISVLAEETTRYNAEYKAALEKSAEYSRAEFFKPEIPPTPVEE